MTPLQRKLDDAGLVRDQLPMSPAAKRGPRPPVLWTMLIALGAAIVGGAVVAYALGGTSTSTGVRRQAAFRSGPGVASWAPVAERAARGVVEITVTRTIRFAAREGVPSESETETVFGTGFVIDRRGSIVTNEHVIEGGGKIRVRLADGTVAAGAIVGSDASTDLAIVRIRVPLQYLHPLPLGTSNSLALGAPVLAIGTPFGYSGSVSAGVVSGFDREIESPNGYTLGDAIQTDAAVNHGNSGGPLLDALGRVVGVNAQLANTGVNGNVGVAFAIPINAGTHRVIRELASTGIALHAWLGVAGATLSRQAAAAVGRPSLHGVEITGISPGSPAARAGLEAGSRMPQAEGMTFCGGGDVLTSIDDAKIETADALQSVLQRSAPGSTVVVGIVHADGTPAWRTVKLVTQPARPPKFGSHC